MAITLAPSMPTNSVSPAAGESCEDFVVRAHRELLATIPDPEVRNAVVWEAWEALYGYPERDRVESRFGLENYEHVRDVQHWQEHEAQVVGPDGQPAVRNNDVQRLIAIIQENNLRIADTDALPALVDKHTLSPSEDDKGKERPKNLGYAGPFRLGMTGRIKPRFAIFGDEHHRKDKLEVLRDRPQRSVEVLTLRANGRSYISPIACLSEAPRLPLPVQYAAINDDGDAYVVDRYSAEPVAAFPGGGNTFIPGAHPAKKKHIDQFGAEPTDNPSPQSQPRKPMALEQEDLKQIADAIMSTPQMQFVSQLMAQAGNSPTAPEPQAPAPSPSPGPSPSPQPQPVQKEPYMMPGMPGVPGMGAVTNRFSALSADDEGDGVVTPEQYAALAESQGHLMREVAELRRDNAIQRARAADADRRVALSDLASRFPHIVDLDDELNRCLYSAGSEMDDDQFHRHVELIETYAARVPAVTPMVPRGEMPERRVSTVETERYEAQISERSLEIYNASLAAGKPKTADQCWDEAAKEVTRT